MTTDMDVQGGRGRCHGVSVPCEFEDLVACGEADCSGEAKGEALRERDQPD
jgi:hypothetical protein